MRTIRAANTLLRSSIAPSVTTSRTVLTSAQKSSSRHQLFLQTTSRHGFKPARGIRSFTSTAGRLKKSKDRRPKDGGVPRGNKDAREPHAVTDAAAPVASAKGSQPNAEDPFDMSDLTHAFDRAEQRHGEALRQVRQGGRFNAETIGAVAVQPDAKSPQLFPLRELATVAPLGGRRWSILAFEEASVKPIVAAVQRSEAFGQQPQRSDDNPLELVLTVEPERAEELTRRIKDACQAWRDRLRDETHKREKVHKKWRADGVILADDLVKLKTKVQKLQDDRMKVIAQKEKEVLQYIASKG